MIYGPGDPYRRLSSYLRRMDDGRRAILMDTGLARWKPPRGYVEDVAAAIALAAVDDRATGRVYNVAEPVAFAEAEWVRRMSEVAGWPGEVVTLPGGRIPVAYHIDQDLDTSTVRIRDELGYAESMPLEEALACTIAWERTHPGGPSSGIGLADYETEDDLLFELGR